MKSLFSLGFSIVLLFLSGCGNSSGGGGSGEMPFSSHPVVLHWTASTSVVNGYKIYRSQTSGGPYSQVGTADASTLTYTDSQVYLGVTYYYTATAFNDTAESIFSNEAVAVVPVK